MAIAMTRRVSRDRSMRYCYRTYWRHTASEYRHAIAGRGVDRHFDVPSDDRHMNDMWVPEQPGLAVTARLIDLYDLHALLCIVAGHGDEGVGVFQGPSAVLVHVIITQVNRRYPSAGSADRQRHVSAQFRRCAEANPHAPATNRPMRSLFSIAPDHRAPAQDRVDAWNPQQCRSKGAITCSDKANRVVTR